MLKDIKFSDASVQVVDSAIDTQLLDENKALQSQVRSLEADINRGKEMEKHADAMLERANKEKTNFLR